MTLVSRPAQPHTQHMKIRVEFTVDVDEDAYRQQFGVEGEQIESDIRHRAQEMVRQQLEQDGMNPEE